MNHIRNVFVHPLSQLLTLLTWTLIMVSDFYRLRVWFRHLILLGCSCPAPSQTRSQAPEYAKCPKWPILLGLCPNHILLLRPYYARNSAGRMCKGLVTGSAVFYSTEIKQAWPECHITNYLVTQLARAVLGNIFLLGRFRTATTSGQYSPVQLELARLVRG